VITLALGCYAAESPAGRWEGMVRIPDRDLNIVIDLAQDSAGQWVGSAVLPGTGVRGAALSDIRVNGDEVSFGIKRVLGGPVLKGRVDGDAFTGNYEQAGNSAPFELRRTGSAQVEMPRKSTAVAAELQGDWVGEMQLMGRRFHVKLNLANQSSGKAAARLIVIGKQENVIPVDLVIQDEDTLTLVSFDDGITVDARLAKGSKEMSGSFTEGPLEAPLSLRMAEHKEHS